MEENNNVTSPILRFKPFEIWVNDLAKDLKDPQEGRAIYSCRLTNPEYIPVNGRVIAKP